MLPDVIEIIEKKSGDQEEVHVIEVPFWYIEPQRAEHVKLDTRAEMGLRLFASGTPLVQAAALAKTKPQKIRALLQTEQGKETLKHIRLELDEEFKALYRDSIQVLRENLHSADPTIKMKAADTFMKYAKEINLNVVLTAEDLVRQLMKGEVKE